jgi:hypothetical protein
MNIMEVPIWFKFLKTIHRNQNMLPVGVVCLIIWLQFVIWRVLCIYLAIARPRIIIVCVYHAKLKLQSEQFCLEVETTTLCMELCSRFYDCIQLTICTLLTPLTWTFIFHLVDTTTLCLIQS